MEGALWGSLQSGQHDLHWGGRIWGRPLKSHALREVFCHAFPPHIVFLTQKKNYHINFSGGLLSLWKRQEQTRHPWVWAKQLLITATLITLLLMKDPHSCNPSNWPAQGGSLLPVFKSWVSWSENLGEDWSITLAEVVEVVKKLWQSARGGRDLPWDAKGFGCGGTVTCLCNVAWRSGSMPLGWQTRGVVSITRKGTWECVQTTGGSHSPFSPGNFTPGCWRGGSDTLSNLRFWESSVEQGK